jgi:hypothetical protein
MDSCRVSWCDRPKDTLDLCTSHYSRHIKGVDLDKPFRRRLSGMTPEARFWIQVDKSGECWTWTGGCDDDGYGTFTAKIEGRRYLRAHRFSYWLATGTHPLGLWVLHHCDNPPCIRPDHLFLGTAADNNADMFTKGRQRFLSGDESWHRHRPEVFKRGDDSPNTLISDADIAEIRRRWASGQVTQRSLADEYGVSTQHMSKICRGERRVKPATPAA